MVVHATRAVHEMVFGMGEDPPTGVGMVSIIHDEPLQTSAKAEFQVYPTETQAFAEVQDTPTKEPSCPSGGDEG